MHQQKGQRLRHASQYRSALAVSTLVIAITGCHTTPPTTTPKPTTADYPTRPNTPAPAIKLFHKTADSLTLVTDPNATDDQIEAIAWQLRAAAHTHTLNKLGIPQFLVDANKTTWFHIYRGSKCAAEKYASGNPPCGASYHAAADYTFGTPGNPTWDQGTLLHNEKETLLWDPDAPYSPSRP